MEQPSTQHIPQQPIPQEHKSQQPIPLPNPAPSPAIYSNPVSVIGPQCCLPYPVHLAIVGKILAFTDGNFTVSDINDNSLFKVKDKVLSPHDERIILDPAGNSIVTITEKLFSLQDRHFPFRGDSRDPKDLFIRNQESFKKKKEKKEEKIRVLLMIS